ncbi:MAG: phospholipase [Sodaliphilus sp.]
MIPAFYIFVLMVVVGVVLYLMDLRSRKHEPPEAKTEAPQADASECDPDCCSTHEVCPSDILLAGCNAEIVYFDDEELDTFKGRPATAYTPEEEEQFRDVLYTLLPTDLLPWEQSIKKRGIILPSAIRDEFVMLYAEQQNKQQTQQKQ